MNAPAPAAAIVSPTAAPTLQFIPLDRLKPSRTHIQALRRQRFDKAALAELAESIKKVGILQPLVGRPAYRSPCINHMPDDPTHEIVAGERRYLAAKLAGLATVPVNVAELTDEQVLEIQLIENLQREGLHALEEAEGYEELMELKSINADAVAAMVGKSRSYVYARTKLLALCPEARKAFYAGALDASKALLIARIGHHDTQRQALKDLTGDRFDGPMSYKAALQHIHRHYMLELAKAPFPTGDAVLVAKAGTCAACPKRTGNQRELFADVKSADVCTDPQCFADKKAAHQARLRAEAEAKGVTVIAGAAAKKIKPHDYSSDLKGYVRLDRTQWIGGKAQTVKQLLGKAMPEPALLEDPHTGDLMPVVSEADLQKALKAKGVRPESRGSVDNYHARQKATEKKNRLETVVRLRTLAALRERNRSRDFTLEDTRMIAEAFFNQLCFDSQKRLVDAWMAEAGEEKPKGHEYVGRFGKRCATMDGQTLGLLMFDAALIGDCHVASYGGGDGKDLQAAAERLGVDAAAIRKQVKQDFAAKAKR